MLVKKFYNYFVSDIIWFSARKVGKSYKSTFDALKNHIKYISNEKREDVVITQNLDIEKWKRISEKELAIRNDARIAAKFFLTLPNDLDVNEALQMINDFVKEALGNPEEVGIAIHRNKGVIEGKDNLHAHIIISTRNKEGKKIDINRETLKRLHQIWKKMLEDRGYKILTATWRKRERVKDFYVDNEVNEKAVEYIKLNREFWDLIKQAVLYEKQYEKQKNTKPEKDEDLKEKRRWNDGGLEL